MEIKATKRAMDVLIEEVLLKKKTLRLAMIEGNGYLHYEIISAGGPYSLGEYIVNNVQNGTRLVLSCVLISRASQKYMQDIEIDYDFAQQNFVVVNNAKVIPAPGKEPDMFIIKNETPS